MCEDTLEEMGLFTSENVSERHRNKFPNVAAEKNESEKKWFPYAGCWTYNSKFEENKA